MMLAAVQMDVAIGQIDRNLERVSQKLREARQGKADLVIFPECALTGYCFNSLVEASEYGETVPGPSIEKLIMLCRELEVYAVIGLLEKDGQQLFNSAVTIGPEGIVGNYRKTHLPFLGVDRFTDYGDGPYQIIEIAGVRVGVNICYDAGFPEPARCLTLLGADLIVLPTNWPTGSEGTPDFAINARALENTIYYAAVDRVGEERGSRFIGRSRICDPLGRTLAQAGDTEETILYAEIDPSRSRKKHLVRVPSTNEINRIADRRPELYQKIIEPHSLVRPGRG